MIPTLSVPNIQVPPPVETSVFTGQNTDAALGRLPVVTVPPTVSNAKVADDGRGGQQHQRQGQGGHGASAEAEQFQLQPFAVFGELHFESPYSTPFIAQLFGQFPSGNTTVDAMFAQLTGESAAMPQGFVDFERLSQMDVVKYMPSLAFRPAAPPIQREAANAAEGGTAEMDLRYMAVASNDLAPLGDARETPSTRLPTLFNSGMEAYHSIQSRNRYNIPSAALAESRKPVSLLL